MNNHEFKSEKKSEIIKKYYDCKPETFFNPLYSMVIVVALVLLPVFVVNDKAIKGIVFGVLGLYLLVYLGALVRRLERKLDLIFEIIASRE